MQRRSFRPAVRNRQANENVVLIGLSVFRKDIEVAVVIKDSTVDEFKLCCPQTAPPIFLDQTRIRKFRLRVFIERLHVGMRRRRVEVVVELLYVLAVIPFGAGKTEKALLQDRVFAIPKSERKAKPALAIGNAEQPIFAPAVGAAARMVVREIIPAISVRRVVFTDGGPLPLR